MPKWYHLESPDKSETVTTQDKSGYDDWTELAVNSRPPEEDEELDRTTGKWKVDAKRKAKRERTAKARDPEHLLDLIEALEARVTILEGIK